MVRRRKLTFRQIRQKLGTILDMKYKPEDNILIEKVRSDDYVGVLANAQFLRDQGDEIPKFKKELKK